MRNAVRLADDARLEYAKENPDEVIKIALALGPFGSTLTPAQDFDGYYPPPFGPKGYSTTGENCNRFGEDVVGEHDAVEALTQFHLERLLIFAHDPVVWRTVDCIAFETIPVAREVKAVRQAMLQLQKILATDDTTPQTKPWWITFVFSDNSQPDSAGNIASDMVSAAIEWRAEDFPIPTGIGINCVSMKLFTGLASLVKEMTEAVDRKRGSREPKQWLVLYPNGGDTYDTISRTWVVQEGSKDSWAADLGGIIEEIAHASVPTVWAGIIGGGCCRTRPDNISALSKILKRK